MKEPYAKHISRKTLCSIWFSIFTLLLICQTACSKRYSSLPTFSSLPIYDAENTSVGRFKTSYLAEQLDSYFHGTIGGRIVVTTFVDINNLYSSSAFGRVLSEQLMSELAMKGYHIVELRQSEVMQIMNGQGEFGLSGEVRVLRKSQDLAGIIVGTYTVSPERIYVNARLLDPANSEVKSVGSVEVALTEEIERLLRTSTSSPRLERIPVRPLGSPPERNYTQTSHQKTTLGKLSDHTTNNKRNESSEKGEIGS